MTKKIVSVSGLLFAVAIFVGVYFYLSNQDKDYDSLMKRAEKKQLDHSEFIDFYGEREPVIPIKSENSQTLLGVDLNNNGIRDDLDVWINRSALTKNETLAMRQYAKAKQEWFKVCEQKISQKIKVVLADLEKSEKCLAELSDYKRMEAGYSKTKLEILLMNTQARKDCSIYYSQTISTNEVMKENVNFGCTFDVQYPENVISGNLNWKKTIH